jgi:hypothetical protein
MSDQDSFLVDVNNDINVYLLGFLWADGHLEKSCAFSLEIRKVDFMCIKHLFPINEHSKYDERQRFKNKIRFGKLQSRYRLSNKTIHKFLLDNDYKCKSTQSPKKILNYIPTNKHYLWWRGFFDGDGCFYSSTSGRSFAVWGSFNQDWSAVITLLSSMNIKYSYIQYTRTSGNSSCIKLTRRDDIKKLGKFLYPNGISPLIGFTRKYDKYIECISIQQPRYQYKKSPIKGIHFNVWTGKWICRKTSGGKRIVIGQSSNFKEAKHILLNSM